MGKRRLSEAAVLVCAAFWVWTTWLRWGGLHPDTGRELLAPKELLDGAMLYRDMRYLYGPLAPCLNALLYGLFGVRLSTLFAAGIATAVLTALTLVALARRVLPEALAAFTGIAFLCVLAFADYESQGLFNFVMPYTFSATYGLLLAVLSLYFLLRSREKGRDGFYALSSLFLGLTLLTKQEISFALCCTHALALAVDGRLRGTRKLLLLGAGLLPAACVYSHYLSKLGWAGLVSDNLFPPGVAGEDFQARVMGTDATAANLLLILKSLAAEWGFCLAAGLLLRLKNGAGLALGVLLALLVPTVSGPFWVLNQYKTLPVLVLLIIAASRGKGREEPLLIAVFAGLLAARRLLKASALHYGFFLLAPGLIVYHYFYFELAPSFFPPATGFKTRAGRAVLAVFFIVLAAQHAQVSLRNYARRTQEFATKYGPIRLSDGNFDRVNRMAIAFMETRTPPGSSLLQLPEGLAINFFSDRPRASALELFEAPAFHGRYEVHNLLAALEAHPPDYVACYHSPDQSLEDRITPPVAAFLKRRYRLIQVLDSSEPGTFPRRIDILRH